MNSPTVSGLWKLTQRVGNPNCRRASVSVYGLAAFTNHRQRRDESFKRFGGGEQFAASLFQIAGNGRVRRFILWIRRKF